jgi:hypothetical protein
MNQQEMSKLATVAVSSPRAVCLQPRFWLAHFDYFAILTLGSLGFIGVLWIFQEKSGTNPNASAGNLSVTLDWVFLAIFIWLSAWSIVRTLKVLAEIMVNRSIATLVEAGAELRLENQAPENRLDFSSLRQLIPRNTSKPEPAMIRFTQQILKEAQDRRFDARFHLLEGYQGESIANLLQLERLQTYALRLGILGTFIGLMLALGSFSMILSSPALDLPKDAGLMREVLENQLQAFAASGWGLVSSLKLCFGTSIEGLVIAFFVAAQAEAVRRRQALYFQEMEDAALSLVALASRSIQRDDLLAGLEDASQAMRSLRGQIYDQSHKLGERLVQVEQRVNNQTTEIQTGLAALAEAREKFGTFLQELSSSQNDFLKDLASLYDVASMRRLFQRLEDSMAGLEKGVSAEVKAGLRGLGEQFGQLCPQLAAFERDVRDAAHAMASKTEALRSSVGKIESQVAAAASQSHRTLEGLLPTLKNLQQATSRFGGLFVLDAALLKRTLIGGSAGLVVGAFASSGNALSALVGCVAGLGVVVAFSSLGGQR